MKKMFFLILILIFTQGCSKKEKQKAVENYGRDYAYSKTSSGKILTLKKGDVSYYLDPSVNGQYKTIAEYSVAKANTLTSKVNLSITTRSDSNFKFKVITSSTERPNALAFNEYTYLVDDAIINSSTITFVKNKMENKSLNSKKYTALHEMGHSFGLTHITDDKMKGYTVMMTSHPSEKDIISDFSEFDRYNITWKYGE